jgi:hypothetical protein
MPAGCRHLDRHHQHSSTGRQFDDSEGLRALLQRLDAAGEGAWRTDEEAAALMRFTVERYTPLARKYGRDPGDAAVAAFEAMRADATRTAADPWAVVTVAVRTTLAAEQRAEGLLTTAARVRRPGYAEFHDAERFGDRATSLADHHPALHHLDRTTEGSEEPGVVALTAGLLHVLGWPAGLAYTLVTHVCAQLADIGSRHGTYEAMRRDKAVRAHFDLTHDCWIGLLRATLGHPSAPGRLGHGILARLLAGETTTQLLTDDALVHLLCPAHATAGSGG